MIDIKKVKGYLIELKEVCDESKGCTKCPKLQQCMDFCSDESPKIFIKFIERLEKIANENK